MEIFKSLILVVDLIAAISITVLVLMQHGKGADMGAAFGSGASGSLFGATGSANFLSRTTAVLAVVFFAASLALVLLSSQSHDALGVMSKPVPVTTTTVPAAPAGGVDQNANQPGKIPD